MAYTSPKQHPALALLLMITGIVWNAICQVVLLRMGESLYIGKDVPELGAIDKIKILWPPTTIEMMVLVCAIVLPIIYLSLRRWKDYTIRSFLPQLVLLPLVFAMIELVAFSLHSSTVHAHLELQKFCNTQPCEFKDMLNYSAWYIPGSLIFGVLISFLWLLTKGKYTYVQPIHAKDAIVRFTPRIIGLFIGYKYVTAMAIWLAAIDDIHQLNISVQHIQIGLYLLLTLTAWNMYRNTLNNNQLTVLQLKRLHEPLEES